MPHDLNSPEHQTHADGFVEALADRSSTYHPDPAPSQANSRRAEEEFIRMTLASKLLYLFRRSTP